MNLPLDLSYWATAGGIVLIDLVLSGDNALIIGAAASRLPRGQRLFAIVWGGLLAIVFRMLLAIVATELLYIPYLRSIGGVILLVIAIRLLLPESPNGHGQRPASARHIELLVAGLLLSMILLFVASALIARIIERIPILMDVAAVVLAWTAANLVVEDAPIVDFVRARMTLPGQWQLYLHLIFVAVIVLVDFFIRLVILPRRRAAQPEKAVASEGVAGAQTLDETVDEVMN
jgi:predicted tellurium resistance membrane protein TerC